MSWAAVAVGVVAAGASAVSTSQANKKAKAVGNSLNDTIAFARDNPSVFGEKIDFEAVDYSPLFREDAGYANLAGDVTAGNRRNLPEVLKLTSDTNKGITANSVDRLNTLYPGFADAFAQQSQNTQNMLRGEIPTEDRNAISARRSEAIALGGGGNTGQQVAADLGLMRMDLMGRGEAALTNNTNLLNIFDPINRHLVPQSSFVDVGQAINSAVAENQFDATFAAAERDAEFNAALIPDPQKAGLMNLLAARSGLQAANPQQNVLLNAAVAGVSAGVNAYAGGGGGAVGSMMGGQQQQPQQQATFNTAPATYGYVNAADQSNGIRSFSGQGMGGGTVQGYNPNTGGSFGDQGGLWSYYNNTGSNNKKYSFQ